MGYTVLYIAFGVVALWLLGEVLLQYKARLRWRVLAFVGFLGVVVGVVLPQVVVIILGAAAFGTGQTLVTLSYRRGFSTGWALGGRPGSSRRRKGGTPTASAPAAGEEEAAPVVGTDPAYGTGDLGYAAQEPGEFGTYGAEYEPGLQETQVYSPEPMHEDTGEYGIYGDSAAYASTPYTGGGYESYGAQGYGTEWQPQPQPQPEPQWQGAANPAASYQGPFQQQDFAAYGYEQQPYQGQESWSGYQQQPYQGFDAYQQPQGYGYGYDAYAEQNAASYGHDSPPAGVWSPQPDQGEHAYIPQQAPPTHDEPQPQHADPYGY
ncbi:hypothetical protein NGB36_13225 [Streptomyces sp. RB6PN25]|uniref:Integral membrane protein n=1 Tax=Streptomyces humicola TaxID=2953240 RepID=A0ABT1PV40_9ACTN|nr:hypothetical protein [Streptomyces humicola]MCQ4081538.1 hypothetical protein [Streptomyces humicola]